MSVLTVHVQHKFNSDANTKVFNVPLEFFSYLMSHLCCMATTFPTDVLACNSANKPSFQNLTKSPTVHRCEKYRDIYIYGSLGKKAYRPESPKVANFCYFCIMPSEYP